MQTEEKKSFALIYVIVVVIYAAAGATFGVVVHNATEDGAKDFGTYPVSCDVDVGDSHVCPTSNSAVPANKALELDTVTHAQEGDEKLDNLVEAFVDFVAEAAEYVKYEAATH